jgi:hypothetical protein
MHPLPSHLAYELFQARSPELERRQHQAASSTCLTRRPRGTRSIRQSSGWFLVELGLRLVVSHGPAHQ